MNKLTREQAALLGCFTGTLFGPFSDVHKKAEQAIGRPILTHEFALPDLWSQLRTAVTEEFLAICPDEEGA